MKYKKIALISVFLLVVFSVTLVTIKNNKSKKPEQKVSTFVKFSDNDETQKKNEGEKKIDTSDANSVAKELGLTSESSSDDNSVSSSSEQNSTSNSDFVYQSMQNFISISLNNDALDVRNKTLKTDMTDELYQSLKVDSDTKVLKTMWSNWQSKKVLDTNQPVQLTNQKIISVNVYQDTTDDTNFIVVASLEILSPASPNTSEMTRQYTVKLQDKKLSSITKVSEVANKNE